MIFAVGNRKGGVGKSTVALHLCAELQRRGRDVLLVDADPQQSVTGWARKALPGLRVEPAGDRGRLLELVQEHVGDTVIDAVGAQDDLHLVAILASDRVVLPTGVGLLDLNALRATARVVAEARAMRRGPDPRAVCVLNRFDERTNVGREALALVAELGLPVVGRVRASVAVADGPAQGRLVGGPAGDDLRAAAAGIIDAQLDQEVGA